MTGERVDFERRLGTGAALVGLDDARSTTEVADVIAEFRSDPRVAYVVPDRLNTPQADPDDTGYGKQWDLFETTAGMDVPAAWPTSTGSGVTVAVIDTGYVTHSDLAANIVAGYDFISDTAVSVDGNGRDGNPADPGDFHAANECGAGIAAGPSSWHGTHVAGTIAAATNNGKGIAGIAPGAKISPLRVLGKCGGYDSDIIDAITWASGGSVSGVPANANVAKVINMSLGGDGACTSATQSAITAAVNRGTTVVVAAGNDNDNVANHSRATAPTSSPSPPPTAPARRRPTPTTAPAWTSRPRRPDRRRQRHLLHAELRHQDALHRVVRLLPGHQHGHPAHRGPGRADEVGRLRVDPGPDRVGHQGERPRAARQLLRRLRCRARGRGQDGAGRAQRFVARLRTTTLGAQGMDRNRPTDP